MPLRFFQKLRQRLYTVVCLSITVLATMPIQAQWKAMHEREFNGNHLHFSDPFNGFAVNLSGEILKTSDGGITWKLAKDFEYKYGFFDVFVIDPQRVIAVGEKYNGRHHQSIVVRTSDGGLTWTENVVNNRSQSSFLTSVFFIDNQKGWACGRDGYIYRSDDGGITWKEQATRADWLSAILELNDIFFLDSLKGFAVGHNVDPYLLATDDGGEHWYTWGHFLDGRLEAVYFADSLHGWAADSYGGVLNRTTNGGYYWEPIEIPDMISIQDVVFLDTLTGYVVGERYIFRDNLRYWENVILKSTDGGDTWEQDLLEDRQSLYSISFPTPFEGRVGGLGIMYSLSVEPELKSGARGRVYLDANADCVNETAEIGSFGRIVKAEPGGFLGYADHNGDYTLYTPPGEFSLSVVPRPNWENSCGQAEQNILVVDGADLHDEMNFPQRMLAGAMEMQVSIAAVGRARPRFPITYVVDYRYAGAVPFTGRLVVRDVEFSVFEDAEPQPEAINESEVMWHFENLEPGAAGQIRIFGSTSPRAAINTDACAEAIFETAEGTEIARDRFCQPVRNSFDPNDILVSPKGLGVKGLIFPEQQDLTYTVRFQNTGNDTAYTVVIRDTLGAFHDLSALELGAASHDYRVELSSDRIIAFIFENIMLPDSNVNEAGSHGFVKYTVGLQRNILPETVIANRASIYFDYNDPIITNTAQNLMSAHPVSVPYRPRTARAPDSIVLYPNPASEVLTITGRDATIYSMKLYNALGVAVRDIPLVNARSTQLDASNLSAGAYFIRVATNLGEEVVPFNISR